MKKNKQIRILDFLYNSSNNRTTHCVELGASKRFLFKMKDGWYKIVSEIEKGKIDNETNQ